MVARCAVLGIPAPPDLAHGEDPALSEWVTVSALNSVKVVRPWSLCSVCPDAFAHFTISASDYRHVFIGGEMCFPLFPEQGSRNSSIWS